MKPHVIKNVYRVLGLIIVTTLYFTYKSHQTFDLPFEIVFLETAASLGYIIPCLLFGSILAYIIKRKTNPFTWTKAWNYTIVLVCVFLLMDFLPDNSNKVSISEGKKQEESQLVYEMFKDYSDLNPEVNGANIYRSSINGYRITIPEGWNIGKGNTLGTEFNARPVEDDAIITVMVGQHKDFTRIKLEKLPIEMLTQKFGDRASNYKILKDEFVFIANQRTRHYKFLIEYEHIDGKHELVTDFYISFRGDKMYNIMTQASTESYNSYNDRFFKTLKSFWFEDYNKSDK